MSNEINISSMPAFNRRAFLRYTSLLAAAGAAFPFGGERALAQVAFPTPHRTPPPDAVMLNLNENPMGPAPEALEAIYAVSRNGGRYQDSQHVALQHKLAELEGLKPEYIRCFPGTTETIIQLSLAFTSPTRSYVQADPTFDIGANIASAVGARVV